MIKSLPPALIEAARTGLAPRDLATAVTGALRSWWTRLRAREDDRFLIAVAVALLLHLLPAVVGVAMVAGGIEIGSRSEAEKPIGDPAGSKDGVNVEMIDAAEYQSKYLSFSAGKDKNDAEATIASRDQPKVEQQQADAEPEKEPEKPETQLESKEEVKLRELEAPGVAPPRPEPKAKPTTQQAQPRQRTLTEQEIAEILESAKQDFQSAAQMTSKAGTAALGSASPFIKGVLRKLKGTMPKSRGMRGTLVVRLVIGDDGGVVWVGIPRSSGNPDLDKLVAETIRTTRFEAPGPQVPMKERRFEITYEYD